MKKYTYSLLAAALACGMAQAAATAYTTPVGYITHTVAPTVIGEYTFADSYLSPSLVNASKFAGQSDASPSGGATITFTGGVPTLVANLDVLEITEGAQEGWWSTVVSHTATSITVADNFPASLPTNTKIAVRSHSTIHSFLGNNNPGLIPFDGVNQSDEVQLLNPATQVSVAIGWVTGVDLGDPNYPDGAWLELSQSVIANDFVIEPGTSVLVRRYDDTPKSFTSTGTVKTTKTQVDLFPSYNWIGTQLAAGSTFGGMNFHTSLNPWDGVSEDYDFLQLVRVNQTADGFAAVDDGGLMMIKTSDSTNADTEPFVEGTGAIIVRTGNPSSTIVIPGTPVSTP